MSKNSKQSRKKELAIQFTLLHRKGQKGPKATKPLHGKAKNNRWCFNRTEYYRRNDKGFKSRFK